MVAGESYNAPRWVSCMALMLAVTAIGGCRIFDAPPKLTKIEKTIPGLAPPPDAIRLDIVFIERPEGDSLLGPELWKQVDEVAALELDTRKLLQQNGFRVGLVGSHPPQALQTLLGMKSDFVYEPSAERAKQLVGRQVVVRSGGESEIRVSPNYSDCELNVQQLGETRRRQFTSAHCVFKLTTHRVQDGWVRLDFIPQVQYGTEQLRPVVGDEGWQYSNGKKMETFFPQRFSVTLGVGEMAVITARYPSPATLGNLFFVGRSLKTEGPGPQPDGGRPALSVADNDDASVHRLLVVRLSDMRNQDDPFRTP